MGADVEQNAETSPDAGERREGGTWVALRDAAALLGVSVDTVKRRMQRGELEARRETIPQGFRWLIRVDPPKTEAVGSPERVETPNRGERYPHLTPPSWGRCCTSWRYATRKLHPCLLPSQPRHAHSSRLRCDCTN